MSFVINSIKQSTSINFFAINFNERHVRFSVRVFWTGSSIHISDVLLVHLISFHFIPSLRWLVVIPVETFYISHFSLRRIFYPSSPIVKQVDLKILKNASDKVFVYWLSLLCRHLIDAVYLLSLIPRSLLLINKIDWLLIYVLRN